MERSDLFFFDSKYLNALATQYHEKYIHTEPYPHIVIDDFLPEGVADNILENFPKPDSFEWKEYKAPTEKKLEGGDLQKMTPFLRHLFSEFNASTFLIFLEKITGIEKLIPDPYLAGGGLHQIVPGGYLKVHADFNYYSRLSVHRRINVLIYLNKDWKEEYGGHLQVWDKTMRFIC